MESGDRRHREGGGSVDGGEDDALPGEGIEVGGEAALAPIRAQMVRAQRVHGYEQQQPGRGRRATAARAREGEDNRQEPDPAHRAAG